MSDFDLRVRRTQAFKALARGDFRQAFQLGSALPTGKRNDLDLWELLGISAARTGRAVQAEECLRKALKYRAKKPLLHLVLGEVYAEQGRLDEALERFDRVLNLQAGTPGAISGKAMVLERRGENDTAAALLQPFIDAETEDAQMAAAYAKIRQSKGEYQESNPLIMKHLQRPGTEFGARRELCKLIARAYEKTGDYDKAFEAFAASNRLIQRPFDADAYVARIDELINTFSKANLAILPRASARSELPVFIASMPRSGSTLCEQIIHAHPQAFGAGEITELADSVHTLPQRLDSIQTYPACLGDLMQDHADDQSRSYLDHLRSYDAGAARIVNKHLDNWLHLGLVDLLLPGARVIHVTRHPLDNCFSIFMAAMNPETYPWATDLTHLGLVYRQHERLMAHWREVLELDVLHVQYEELVNDPTTWIRSIIDFCGLPWAEQCLSFHEKARDVMTLSYDQVRRPIYTSAVKRYENYLPFIEPLKIALASGTE